MNKAIPHLGEKIRSEMLRLGLQQKDLAAHFQMKAPSVTEMLQTGRLAKDKYQRLVDLNKRSLDWWFGIDRPEGAEATPPIACEASAPYPVAAEVDHYRADSANTAQELELLRLFRGLPSAEQDRMLADMRQKAEFYSNVFTEMLARKALTHSH